MAIIYQHDKLLGKARGHYQIGAGLKTDNPKHFWIFCLRLAQAYW
jgi:hypothetical protein